MGGECAGFRLRIKGIIFQHGPTISAQVKSGAICHLRIQTAEAFDTENIAFIQVITLTQCFFFSGGFVFSKYVSNFNGDCPNFDHRYIIRSRTCQLIFRLNLHEQTFNHDRRNTNARRKHEVGWRLEGKIITNDKLFATGASNNKIEANLSIGTLEQQSGIINVVFRVLSSWGFFFQRIRFWLAVIVFYASV